jgi:hypothetical protein
MSKHSNYLKLPTGDIDDDEESHGLSHQRPKGVSVFLDEEDEQLDRIEYDQFLHQQDSKGSHVKESQAISNDTPQPITRPPTKYRDLSYGVVFVLHFIIILSLSFAEEMSLHHAALSYNRAGSEASIVMIVTLLGGVFGALLLALLLNSAYKEELLSYGLVFSILVKIVIANILLIMRSLYSFIGIIFLFAALWDYLRYHSAKQSIPFTVTILELLTELINKYGTRLVIICGLIIAVQTCILFWWGAFFIGLISTVDAEYLFLAVFFMFFSFYWITQFFHMMISFVVGGCILRLFLDDDSSNSANQQPPQQLPTASNNKNPTTTNPNSANAIDFRPSIQQGRLNQQMIEENIKNRVYLYFRCSLTTSFGSLSKGALFITPAYFMFLYKYSFLKLLNSPSSSSWLINAFLPCIRAMMFPFNRALPWLYEKYFYYYHKLSLPLLAVYGKTFTKTSEFYYFQHPETLLISLEEFSSLLFASCNTTLSGCFAILFAVLAESKHEATWPLFFVICYLLLYSGISLSLMILTSAIDALIIASVISPEKVSEKNQIICLRFLRLSEVELR